MKRVLVVTAVYLIVSASVLTCGYLYPSESTQISSPPILLSVLLLIPLSIWALLFQQRIPLSSQADGGDKRQALTRILALFSLAMLVRTVSILMFNLPLEKTPVTILLVLTVLLVEAAGLHAFGFKTETPFKALLRGLTFFALFTVSQSILIFSWVHAFGASVDYTLFNMRGVLAVLPFMFCVGISEEGLFRGYAQTHLNRFYTPNRSILLQALLFGVWHIVWDIHPFEPGNMLMYFASTFIAGLLFGYAYRKMRNLAPLIIAHALGNSWQHGVTPVYKQFGSVLEGVYPALQLFAFLTPYLASFALTFIYTKYGFRNRENSPTKKKGA